MLEEVVVWRLAKHFIDVHTWLKYEVRAMAVLVPITILAVG